MGPECELSISIVSLDPMFFLCNSFQIKPKNLKGLIQLPTNPQNIGHEQLTVSDSQNCRNIIVY